MQNGTSARRIIGATAHSVGPLPALAPRRSVGRTLREPCPRSTGSPTQLGRRACLQRPPPPPQDARQPAVLVQIAVPQQPTAGHADRLYVSQPEVEDTHSGDGLGGPRRRLAPVEQPHGQEDSRVRDSQHAATREPTASPERNVPEVPGPDVSRRPRRKGEVSVRHPRDPACSPTARRARTALRFGYDSSSQSAR
jgi:hypothetical protein